MKISSIRELEKITNKIKKALLPGDVVFLYGEIGVGKTTFVRSLINNFELQYKIKESEVLSPTFNIVFNYKIGKIQIMHYDLFRINKSKDIDELGIFTEEKDNIILVEWPELIVSKPKDRIDIQFQYSKLIDSRKIKIIGFGKWKDYKFNGI